ncbi:hypothetical protein AMAG_00133 [Allomyces macrogynus ATCC 38327]|uniref:Uncharacterized protein n=1 Tax=Allomyces macrogynus (strain ATCC 38327) TaxID=578462 RepID=A0A0L0RVM6_ALLM3|nr:hypothetical protein AMAG_00133 [Allomyces macrogynus ATCC 38327]|eukprot:KNE54131.1 hypothetical protein AMAG_00133 [Allomyces macrogynus ATCC 38327]
MDLNEMTKGFKVMTVLAGHLQLALIRQGIIAPGQNEDFNWECAACQAYFKQLAQDTWAANPCNKQRKFLAVVFTKIVQNQHKLDHMRWQQRQISKQQQQQQQQQEPSQLEEEPLK